MAELYDKDGNRLDVGGAVNIVRQLLSGIPIAKINDIQLYAPSGGGSYSSGSVPHGKRGIGCAKFQPIIEGAINHIVEYGQSLSRGGDSVAITTNTEAGCYMLGDKTNDYESTEFSLLRNINDTDSEEAINTGEDMVVPTIHALKYLCLQNRVDTEFLGTSSGNGGMSIDRLSKNSDSGYHLYQSHFLTHVNHAKTAATNANKRIVCPAIMYIQGENDYGSSTQYQAGYYVLSEAETEEAKYRPAIDYYKRKLVQLKNDMQADIMSAYGQDLKPLFFVHAVGTESPVPKGSYVNMAQIEACAENDDMILVGAPTFAPRNGVHLTGNGYRWWAEFFAKAIFEANFLNYKFEPVCPIHISKADNDKIVITHHVPCPPLVIDYNTVGDPEYIRNCGFYIYKGENTITITSIEVSGCDVILTVSGTLSGTYEIRYIGHPRTNGRGNICDSQKWESLYPYMDDSVETYSSGEPNYRPKDENGNYIFGQKFPMQNWCVPYTKFVTF